MELQAMYVCVCHAITNATVERAAAGCSGTLADLYRRLETRPTCGKCVPMVRDIARGADLAALTGQGAHG
jgi:bacterioferritin-associated ferredoxin